MTKKSNSKRGTIGIVLLFTIGFLILLYPWISDTWNTRRQQRLMVNVNNNVKEMSEEDRVEEFKKAYEYNRGLVGSEVPDVFAIRQKRSDPEYEKLLNPCNNGIMAAVDIPRIKVHLPIYHYTTEDVLTEGAGHICGSSLPVGGESTHCVISAHRGLPSAKMFTDLDLIKKGDHFYVKVLNETLAYKVDRIDVVEPDDTRSLSITKGKDQMSLVTCTPYGVNTKRLIVRGHRVPYDEKVYKDEGKHGPTKWSRVLSKTICVLLGLLIAYMVQKLIDHKSKRKIAENEKKRD